MTERSIPPRQKIASRPRWKTPQDFAEMKTIELFRFQREYQELARQGVLPGQGGRALTQAEQIRLQFYLAVIQGELEKRGETA